MPASFFLSSTAKNVWKSVAGVSAAGAKRGRGRGTGRAVVKDFNRGQEIGVGRKKLVLGGLNAPIAIGKTVTPIQDVGENKQFHENLSKVRREMNVYRKRREHPMERGWSGRKTHGRQAGPPDPINETNFENFNSTVLMLRSMLSMTGILGRTRSFHALVVVGNGNGLAGFAEARGKDGKAVVRHARNRAGQQLISIPRWENHTVLHDFYSRYYSTTVFVERKPKGYGIKAHRIIQAICQAFGITDIYAKVEGSTSNQLSLTRAFFLGLINQRKYEDMAEEKGLHLVELRQENFNMPAILASPKSEVKTDDEIKNENNDFTYYIYEGRVRQIRPKLRYNFEHTPTWYRYLDKLDYEKNRERTKLLLAAKYGDTKVKDVFPYFRSNAESFNKPKEES